MAQRNSSSSQNASLHIKSKHLLWTLVKVLDLQMLKINVILFKLFLSSPVIWIHFRLPAGASVNYSDC